MDHGTGEMLSGLRPWAPRQGEDTRDSQSRLANKRVAVGIVTGWETRGLDVQPARTGRMLGAGLCFVVHAAEQKIGVRDKDS